MKKIGIVTCLCWMMAAALWAGEPSVMRIGGKAIPLSEFKWYLRQSNQFKGHGRSTSFQYFLNYQLKVADARERRLDTLPDFRRQCDFLQACVLKEHFTNHQLADSYYHHWSAQQIGRLKKKEWVRMDVLTYRLSQHPTMSEEGNAVRVMDELYDRLCQAGASLETNLEWAKAHAVIYENEANRWIPVNSLLNEIIERQAALKTGTYSLPFYSPKGIHIVRLMERRDTPDQTEMQSRWVKYVDGLGAASPAFDASAFNQWKQGKNELPAEVKFQLKQISDGLLAMYWDEQFAHVSQEVPSPQELERYFLLHKSDYNWELPHFKGAVIHCVNKKAASKIKKQLKKYPMALWKEALRRMQQADSKFTSEIECGLYQIGKNAYVDRLAFKCGQFRPHQKLPYTFVLGKKIKGPEHYSDVLQQVVSDYQMQRENDRFSNLFSRFKVEINEDALKTVNSCGNK